MGCITQFMLAISLRGPVMAGLALFWLLLCRSSSTLTTAAAAVDGPRSSDISSSHTANRTNHPTSNVEECNYKLTTLTGKKSNASFKSEVSLRLDNREGASVFFPDLDNGKKHFKPGHTDHFSVNGACVSDLCKLTLFSDRPSGGGTWYVDSISYSMDTPIGTRDQRTWDVNQWFPRGDDPSELFTVVNDCYKKGPSGSGAIP